MYHIVIIKKVDGVIRRRYTVGYTTDRNDYLKVKEYFNDNYSYLKDFSLYSVTLYRLRPIRQYRERIDDFFKD